tara:strand:- start:139 stop:402 length:264 start_codon:yes stop_codon:yes gene_type:complete
MSNFYLFNEKVEKKTGIIVLAQNYVDRGAHPKHFKKGRMKNEITEVYNNRKILQIKELSNKVIKNLSTLSTKKLDELYLQLSSESKQ